jgi:Protein of unknown function (DUF2934)
VSYSQRSDFFGETLMARTAKKTATTTTKNVVAMRRPASTSDTVNPSSAEIAKRAFEIYCERGGVDGNDVQDWLQAERELTAMAKSTAA